MADLRYLVAHIDHSFSDNGAAADLASLQINNKQPQFLLQLRQIDTDLFFNEGIIVITLQ